MEHMTHSAVHELKRLQRRVRRRALAFGLFGWCATAVPLGTATVWLAGGEAVRGGFIAAGLSVSLLAALLGAAFRYLWRPWRRYAGLRAFALRVEASGQFDNLIVAAEEAARSPGRWPADDAVARELARRLDARARELLVAVTPAQVHPLRGLRLRALALGAGLAAAVSLAAISPATVVRGLTLLSDPLGVGGARVAAGLFAEPAPAWVLFGSEVTLAASDFAVDPQSVRCEVRFGEAAWTTFVARSGAAPAGEPGAPGLPSAGRRWTSTVSDVREDFSWRFRRGDVVTATGQVAVRRPPLLAQLSARVEPPAYTGLPATEVERLPALSEVPAGSRVTLTGRAGHDLAAAWLALSGGDSLAMKVDRTSAKASLVVATDISFTVGLRDGFGLQTRDPLEYRLGALADQPPGVLLTRPGDDGRLPLDGKISLLVEAGDDFGLRRLDLIAGPGGAAAGAPVAFGPRAKGEWQVVHTAAGDLRMRAQVLDGTGLPLRATVALDIEAGAMDLVPGDVLEILVEARDNRAPGEGQATRSTVLRLALPSASSVLAAQADSARASRDQLEDARERSRRLDDDLQRLTRELLKNPVTDWARQQEIEAALTRQQAMQKELARVAEELRRRMEELARGGLTSESQMERSEQLADLLTPPTSEPLEDLLKRLEAADGKLAPDDVARAMEEVTQAQKDLARRLDAALAVMKRMAEEQNLEGMTALLEDLMRKQQELADLSREMEKSPPSDRAEANAEIARRQEALARELDELRSKLEQALAQNGEEKDGGNESEPGEKSPSAPPSESPSSKSASKSSSAQEKALREALDKLKKQQSEGSMDKASRALQQMDPKEAARMQQQALRDLGSLYSVLVASQQAMQSALKMEQVSSLRGLAADLLALSGRQEELGTRIPAQLQDVRNVELTRQQHRLQKAAVGTRERLSELTREAPNRILKLLEKLDGLIEEMGGGVRALDEGRAAAARESAGRSLAECNRIVIGLLTEAQMSSSGGGGGGGGQQSASEQLQELARQQAQLNGATEELRQMLADRGISQSARAQMQRLGQEQARLGQELGRIAEDERKRPEGDGARLLGDVGELGRQMERVGGDLGDGQVDQETLQRQDRILGRLLDARNSVRERNYSARRESRAATRTFGPQSGRTGSGEGEAGPDERQRYRRLEDAPLEYRELVRRYFSAIDSLRRNEARGPGEPGVLP
jgi:hypothetical protein